MKKSKGMQLGAMFAGMLILMALLAVPVVSAKVELPISNSIESGSSGKCSTCTTCGVNKSDIKTTEIKGIEKKNAVISALNLPEVKALKTASMEENIAITLDMASTVSMEKKMENGSVKKVTVVVLPAGVVDRETAVEVSNIVTIWDNEKTMAMRYTNTVNKKDNSSELKFTVVGENNKLIEAKITKKINANGTVDVVKDIPEEFTALSYWDCVKGCILKDCLCAFMGIPCPPGLPNICTLCLFPCSLCYQIPSPYTCGPCGICLGVEAAKCMVLCYF